MPNFLHRRRCRLLFAFILAFCLGMMTGALAAHLKEDLHTGEGSETFSVLVLGDSQMAGAGWDGGYANCIQEENKNAQVINLAQNGSILANGDMHRQWAFFLEEGCPMTDFVLLDGGCNDLFYLLREEWKDTGLTMVKEAFSSLVEHIHEVNPDARIIYVLMPPLAEWKDNDYGPPSYERQERFWKEMNMLASSYDYVTVLDLFSLNPFHFPCIECYNEYFADSIHLNEAGYRKTYEAVSNIITVNLVNRRDQ